MQWPALLRPLSQLAELPKMVLERYAGVQTVAFCGVFPEIGRAWASIDNSLFLWRYDRWCVAASTSCSTGPGQEIRAARSTVQSVMRRTPPMMGDVGCGLPPCSQQDSARCNAALNPPLCF